MRYFILDPYADVDVVDGESIPPRPCPMCGRAIRRGQVNLTVRVSEGTHPDALAVMDGPEWLASPRLKELIETFRDPRVTFLPVFVEGDGTWSYEQVLVEETLPSGNEAIAGGARCSSCGGDVQLHLEPLYLAPVIEPGPLVATLRESMSVVLVREDLRAAMVAEKLDASLVPALFEGEQMPPQGATFEGSDWSDL